MVGGGAEGERERVLMDSMLSEEPNGVSSHNPEITT